MNESLVRYFSAQITIITIWWYKECQFNLMPFIQQAIELIIS